jgi:hypothetical protein
VNCARRELLPRAGFAGDEDRRIRAGDAPEPLVDPPHRLAVAHQVVIELQIGVQPLGLALQRRGMADVLQRRRGNPRHRGDELQVVIIEGRALRGDDVDRSRHRLADRQRHAQQRPRLGRQRAVHPERARHRHVPRENPFAALERALDDGPADLDVFTGGGSRLDHLELAVAAREHDGDPRRGHELAEQAKQFLVQLLFRAQRVDGCADRE